MPTLNLHTGQRVDERAAPIAGDILKLSGANFLSSAEMKAGFKAQFRYFYGQERGFFPLDEAVRDDEAPTGVQMLIPTEERPDIPNRRVWCYYDPERPDLLERAADIALEKAQRSGNIYLTRTLFERKRATKDSAKPSRIIAVEDAPAELPLAASRVLRTSPGSRQAFYRLQEPVSNARAEKLSRLIARVLHADKSGTNANKVLRLVGGLNTKSKYGTPYRVNVESRGPDYTYDELWRIFSALVPAAALAELETQSQRDRAAIRWPEEKEQLVAYWLKHRAELMDSKMPRVFRLAIHSQGHKIFGDEAYIAGWRHEGGSWDASTVRWVRAANLVRAGVTDEMAAAMLEAAELPETIRIKGITAVRNDIRDRVTTARETESDRRGRSGYNLVGEWARKRQPKFDIPAEGQAEERSAGGRPAALSAEALLAFYHERAAGGIVAMTRAEVAEALHVSPATIYRLNSDLKTRGEIAVAPAAGRQRSEVRLLRLVKTPSSDNASVTRSAEALERVETPQNAIGARNAILVTHVVVNPTLEASHAHEPAVAPEEPARASGEAAESVRTSQSTPEAVAALIDAPEASPATLEPPKSIYEAVARELAAQTAMKTNVKTGRRYRGRASFDAVLAGVLEHFPNAQAAAVRGVYERQMVRIRREMRQDSEALAVMGYSDNALYDKLRAARGSLAAASRARPEARPGEAAEKHAERVAQWEKVKRLDWKYRRDVDRFTAELERRGLSPEPPMRRQRTRQEGLQRVEVITAVPSQDELFTRFVRAPLPSGRAELWAMLEYLCAARGVAEPTETLTLDELATRVEQLRQVALTA